MNDNLVSPVVGVILMVGITVILAAGTAAFVFGMSGGMEFSSTSLFDNTKNIIIIDKTITPHGDYVFTDSNTLYYTNWMNYRKLETNKTYQFTCRFNTCILKEEVP